MIKTNLQLFGGGNSPKAKRGASNTKAKAVSNAVLNSKTQPKEYAGFKVGDEIIYTTKDFEGTTRMDAKITKVYDDYAIAETADGISLWIDKDTMTDNNKFEHKKKKK